MTSKGGALTGGVDKPTTVPKDDFVEIKTNVLRLVSFVPGRVILDKSISLIWINPSCADLSNDVSGVVVVLMPLGWWHSAFCEFFSGLPQVASVHPGTVLLANANSLDTRYVRNGDDQSPTSSSPVLTARCTMYVQKALNLNKGVKLWLSKIVGIILL
jgi:hypothetical protein